MGAGALHRVHQSVGIVQQRTGTQVVPVPGLTLLVGSEQRGLEGLQQGVGADIGVGVVNKGAGLVVAVGVDMEVHPAAGQAALGILAVIPEVQGEQRFGLPELKNGKTKTIQIDCTDLAILRWLVDFYPSMKKINVDGREYAGYPHHLLEFQGEATNKRLHPTQKPVKLLEYLVSTYTEPGETVLDNCMGSGSTGVACVNTGRSFIGIEKYPHYFQVAAERIESEALGVAGYELKKIA